MEENKKNEQLTEEAAPAPENESETGQKNEPKNGKKSGKRPSFLITYIFALLFIALLLVFLSYLSQLRTTRAQIENLTEEHNVFSVSALNSIDKLTSELESANAELKETRESLSKAENERDGLKYREEELQRQLDASAAELGEVKEEYADLWNESNELSNRIKALSIATEITELVRLEDYESAMELADTFMGSSLEELTETEYPVQYAAYAAAIETLNENFEE